MVALHAALRLPSHVAGVLSFAGRLVDGHSAEVTARPPVLLVHGTDDIHVPADESVQAYRLLRSWGVAAELQLLEGLGHTMDRRALDHATEFLLRCRNVAP